MARISVRNADVDIPIYAIGSNSLKMTLIRKTVGGRLSKAGSNLIIKALSDINLEARDGDRIGLIGHNGAGKSTLLRLLAGVYPPTAGSSTVIGRVSAMFDISLGMVLDATGLENVRLCGALWGLSRAEINASIDDIREFTELDDYLSIPVRTYSAGMLLRLSFAISTLRQPEVLLLDEVIGVGDAHFLTKAKARLTQIVSKSQILVVSSHSEFIIRDLCNKCLWLDRGRIQAFGPVEEVLGMYNASVALAANGEASAMDVPPAPQGAQ